MKRSAVRFSVVVLSIILLPILLNSCKKAGSFSKEKFQKMSFEQCRLVFISSRDGNSDIYSMNHDGTDVKRLTNNTVQEFAPSYSPNANKIAYISGIEDNYAIFTMNTDGSGQKCIFEHPRRIFSASWSPDGKKIAFVLDQEPLIKGNQATRNYEIYVIDADGSNLQRLTNNKSFDFAPFWSPNSKKITFYSNTDQTSKMYIMNADGSNKKSFTDNPDEAGFWSPDGESMIMVSNKYGNPDIFLFSNDGVEQKRLTDDPNPELSMSYSPDGQKITFIRVLDSNNPDRSKRNHEIYIMNSDGSGQKKLTYNPGIDYTPSWAPDGKKIAFTSIIDTNNFEVFIMNPDGSELNNLTNNPAGDSGAVWIPSPNFEN